MTLRQRRGRRLLFLAAATLLTLSAVIAVFSERRQQPKQSKIVRVHQAERVTKPPMVMSKVKDLQIAGVDIVDQGTPQASVAINIINNSDDPVVSLELSAGDRDDWSALGIDGLEDPDKPMISIPARTLKTFTWHLGSILEGYPIVISGARFASGKEDGEALTLESMHRDYDRNRSNKSLREEKAKKGGTQ